MLHLLQIAVEQLMHSYFVDYKKNNNHIALRQWTPFFILVARFQGLFANDARPQLYEAMRKLVKPVIARKHINSAHGYFDV